MLQHVRINSFITCWLELLMIFETLNTQLHQLLHPSEDSTGNRKVGRKFRDLPNLPSSSLPESKWTLLGAEPGRGTFNQVLLSSLDIMNTDMTSRNFSNDLRCAVTIENFKSERIVPLLSSSRNFWIFAKPSCELRFYGEKLSRWRQSDQTAFNIFSSWGWTSRKKISCLFPGRMRTQEACSEVFGYRCEDSSRRELFQ